MCIRDRYYTTTFGEANAAMAEGRAAMKMEGTWFLLEAPSFFDEYGTEWGWAPLPTRDGVPVYSLGIGSTFSINNASQNKDAAAQVIDFIFSPEVQARLLVDCALAPAPIDIPADLLTALDPRQAGIVEALDTATSAGNYGYTTWTFFPPQTGTYLIEQIESVWAGNITTEQFLQGMQDIFSREYAAGEVILLPERNS
jgi:raffinose/stachyose/melibiose transport system substrate-binding protein